MTDKDKMREEFERNIPYKLQLHKNSSDGSYINGRIQFAWLLYQAAKESSRKELEAKMRMVVEIYETLRLSYQELEAAKQRIAKLEDTLKRVQKQSSDRLIGLCKCGNEREALEKKLAEQQALVRHAALCFPSTLGHAYTVAGAEELTKLLAAARKEGFEEGKKLLECPICYEAGKQAGRDELQKELSEQAAPLSHRGYCESCVYGNLPAASFRPCITCNDYGHGAPTLFEQDVDRPLPPQVKG